MNDIAVIVPVYNGEEFLDSCITSIKEAGKRLSEIIIVDDGSTDKTLEKANKLAKEDKRIKVIHTENHGSYMARITGIKATTSPFIAFIDVDDRFTSGALDFLADLRDKTDVEIAIGGYLEVDSLYENIMKDCSDRFVVHKTAELWPRLMKWKTQEFQWYLWNKLYKRELFHDLVEMEGLCQGDDVLLTTQVFLKANTVVETKRNVYLYYQNPNSMLHSRFGDKDLDLICVWDKVVELTEGENVSSIVKGKTLHDLAMYNRWRLDFTLITRLILSGDKDNDQKYAEDILEWREGLKYHWKDLTLPHAMPRSREMLVIALRFFYSPVKYLLRVVRRRKLV